MKRLLLLAVMFLAGTAWALKCPHCGEDFSNYILLPVQPYPERGFYNETISTSSVKGISMPLMPDFVTTKWTGLALMGIDQDAQTLRDDREMGYRSDGVLVWRAR